MNNRVNVMDYSEYRIERNRERRIRNCRRQFFLLALTVILVLFFTISYHAIISHATEADTEISYKYYKSIEIENGDTLWTLADTYAGEQYASTQDYIDEVIHINHLSDDTIIAGQYLIVPYYSTEFK